MPVPPVSTLSRRALLRGAASACAVAAIGCVSPSLPTVPSTSPRLRLLGETTLPNNLAFRGTTVGGLSAIDHDPASGLWLALSDDRSELQPARLYALGVDVSQRGIAIALRDVITLRQAGGQPFPRRQAGGEVVDPEGLRLLPGGRSFLWTSEGDARVNQPPGLREARIDGSHARHFEIPATLHFASRPGSGPRENQAFEGIALTPDARVAWVSMEGPLHEDGPEPGVGRPGGPCRFTAFDVATGRVLRQVAYMPDAIPHAPVVPGGYADNGVSEILMLDATRMLVMERAYSMGVGNSIRLYEIDTAAASDTQQLPRLAAGSFTPASKRLVADFAHLGLSRIDNFEGLCWGPRLASGARTLVAVSDDNFSARQVTQFAAFEYLETT
jgi:hypothetical protein